MAFSLHEFEVVRRRIHGDSLTEQHRKVLFRFALWAAGEIL